MNLEYAAYSIPELKIRYNKAHTHEKKTILHNETKEKTHSDTFM